MLCHVFVRRIIHDYDYILGGAKVRCAHTIIQIICCALPRWHACNTKLKYKMWHWRVSTMCTRSNSWKARRTKLKTTQIIHGAIVFAIKYKQNGNGWFWRVVSPILANFSAEADQDFVFRVCCFSPTMQQQSCSVSSSWFHTVPQVTSSSYVCAHCAA